MKASHYVQFSKHKAHGYKFDVNKMADSMVYFGRLSNAVQSSLNKSHLREVPMPKPQAMMWKFKSSQVPSGIITVQDAFTRKELELMERSMAWMHSKDPKDWPEAIRNHKPRQEALDFTKYKNRVKAYFGYAYSYKPPKNGKKPKKGNKLFKNQVPISTCPIFDFIKLRMQALFPGMYEPTMFQSNLYMNHAGLLHHSDELEWFPWPIHSLKLDGNCHLSFGMYGQGGVHQHLKDLSIPCCRGEVLRMGGILQVLFKHGVPVRLSKMQKKVITVLARKVNEHSVDKLIPPQK